MADTWYARVNSSGKVIAVFCDDTETPISGDIPLSTEWYFGRAPGVCATNFLGELIYKVENGRLVPQVSVATEIECAKRQKIKEVNRHGNSPTISAKRRARRAAAMQEAETHIAQCINPWEVNHTLLLGY